MLLLSNYCYNISPWPCMVIPLALNSLVHVFVYAYYGTSALRTVGDFYKQFLTVIQIAQFLIGLFYCTIGYLYYGFCIYSILFGLSMLYLFGNFYYGTYILKKEKHRKLKLVNDSHTLEFSSANNAEGV